MDHGHDSVNGPALPRPGPVSVQTVSGQSVSGQTVAMLAVVVLAVVLRLRHAAASMVFDEMASLYFSGQPWRHLWGWWMVRETNPPLFYSLLKLWRAAVPMGHWTLRALPLAIGFAQLALFGWLLRARLGWPAAVLGLLLSAVAWSDIYQAAYLRGYGLARIAVTVSFIGLVIALEARGARPERSPARGWALFVTGAVIAIYCHTTMVLWPVIATLAVLAEAAIWRAIAWRQLGALILADLVTMVLSGWVLVMALAQLHSMRAANIAWLEPLGWADFAQTCNLQLLTGGLGSAALMGVLIAAGLWRARHLQMVRLAAAIAVLTVAVFKATDTIHPIVSDFTLHWAFGFTALVAAAPLASTPGKAAPGRPVLRRAAAIGVIGAMALTGLIDLLWVDYIGVPQDFRQTLRTVAMHPGAALLASHEAEGVVIEQACLVEFGHTPGRPPCPFPLVVLTDPKPTDNWAFGGYQGQLVPPPAARAALGGARTVYAFSRYYYTPLQHLGLDPGDWHEMFWDDGELIGPIPVSAFDPPAPGEPPRVPDPHAEYTGAPDSGG